MCSCFFATHGETDREGRFYLFPPNTGTSSELNQDLLAHAISSDDLSDWIRDIFAGDIVLILDVCHSGAAVGTGFKPGPFGNRGLGQLAYDKGMRILAATQADNEAQGITEKREGFLTFALWQGIEERQAADEFFHTSVSLKDWLEYGRSQVPELYYHWIPKSMQTEVQRPILLDFSPKDKAEQRLVAFFYK